MMTSNVNSIMAFRTLAMLLTILLIVNTTISFYTYMKVSSSSADFSSSGSNGNQNNSGNNNGNPLHPNSVLLSRSTAAVGGSDGASSLNGRKSASIQILQHTFPIHTNVGGMANDGSKTANGEQDANQSSNNNKEVEYIPHPGLAMVSNKNLIPDDLPATLLVPRFFDEAYGHVYGTSTIRQYLGNGQVLPTLDQAQAIGSYTLAATAESDKADQQEWLETIYCSIASYRDYECRGTVEDLYQRAAHPERIRVAILDQRTVDGSDDAISCIEPAQPCSINPEQSLCKYRHLIDYVHLDSRYSVGPVFARHLANRFYRGEYFAMQIDSHVRFVEHWDTDIVQQWKSANNEMGVLTTYLSDIQGSINPETHAGQHYGRPIMCMSDFEGSGDYKHLRHGQQPEGPARIKGQPTLHPFWAAGFSFARGHFVIQVPYDQHLPMVFQGEEISIGLRGFTYGYDYYTPERSVCFHMYAIKENEEKRKKVPLFWENSRMYASTGMRAMRRLNSIIGMAHHPPGSFSLEEADKYGLGTIRTPEKFFKTFGIHVEEQRVEQHLCKFVGKPMMDVFLPALRSNKMGIDYNLIDYEFVDPDLKKQLKKGTISQKQQQQAKNAELQKARNLRGEPAQGVFKNRPNNAHEMRSVFESKKQQIEQ